MDESGKRVLVVDDESVPLTLVARMLTYAGYRVSAARSAGDALRLLGLEAPAFDLVVTDLLMPETDGHTLGRLDRRAPSGATSHLHVGVWINRRSSPGRTGRRPVVSAEAVFFGGARRHGAGPGWIEALRFTCANHLPVWATRIRGAYVVLERDEWEARVPDTCCVWPHSPERETQGP